MARNTEKLIREYAEDFKAIVSRDVKKLTTKEEQDFLFKNIDMWDMYLVSLYAEVNTALSINDIGYQIDGDNEHDHFQWKKKALYFKGNIQSRLGEVKLLLKERYYEEDLKKNSEKFIPHLNVMNQILAELKEMNKE